MKPDKTATRTSPPPERDPEFHAPGLARLPRRQDRGPSLVSYQRLVANPFLGVFGLLAWGWGGFKLLARPAAPPALVVGLFALAGFAILRFAFHFHCRDCGASAPFRRWREHACPAVLERYRAGRPRHLHGPAPPAQVLLWIYVLLGLVIVVDRWIGF